MSEVSSVSDNFSVYCEGAIDERERDELHAHSHHLSERSIEARNSIRGHHHAAYQTLAHRQILPMTKSVGGTVEAKKENDGTSSLVSEVHFSAKDNDGNKVSVTAQGSVKNDNEGNINTSGSVQLSYDKEF